MEKPKNKQRISLVLFGVILWIATILSIVNGHWQEWWVEYLLVPLSLIAGTIGIYEVLIYKHFTKRFAVWSAVISFLILTAAVVVAYELSPRQPSKTLPIADNTIPKWQPPELPPNCSNVFVLFGGHQFKCPIWFAEIPPTLNGEGYKRFLTNTNPPSGTTVKTRILIIVPGNTNDFIFPIYPCVKNNRLFIYADMPFQNKFEQILMSDDLDSQIPPRWDRNYTSNAFEIVREDGLPVLQVIYKRANEVQVNGFFIVNTNYIFASFGSLRPELFCIPSLSNQSAVLDFISAPYDQSLIQLQNSSNIQIGIDRNGVHSISFSNQKPIFRYPSWKYLGKFVD